MSFEDDWLMKQVTGAAQMIGKVFRLEISHLDLGLVEDQKGRLIKGEDYLDALIADEQIDEAIVFIKYQMRRLSSSQYDVLVDNFLSRLRSLDKVVIERHHLDSQYLLLIEEQLKEFDW